MRRLPSQEYFTNNYTLVLGLLAFFTLAAVLFGFSALQANAANFTGQQLTLERTTRLVSQAVYTGADEQNVVHAVMFWMDGCPHCHDVIDKVLPPLQEKYGDQLLIHLIELKGGQEVAALYDFAESMGIDKNNVGVPFMIIGEHVLIGSGQIPAELPGLIEKYLAAGGVAYPDTPALAPLLPQGDASAESSSDSQNAEDPAAASASTAQADTGSAAADTRSTAQTGATEPPNGFTLAVIVLVFMVAALIFSMLAFFKILPNPFPSRNSSTLEWINPLLILAGLGVAGYLAYVETQSATAICGPVGDCNAVQHSPYARLFGILPIGVLGVFGYLAILAAWVVRNLRSSPFTRLADLALFGMTLAGTLFSIYLTYLEPFVIKAVCMWCLSSAVIMTILLVLNVKPASQASYQYQVHSGK